MLRRWLALILLVLQLHPVLALVPGQVGDLTLAIEHSRVHDSGQGHRHDEMTAFQVDADGTSLSHVHHDAGHHSAMPLTVADLQLPSLEPEARVMFVSGRLPDPHLEGPLRPPQLSV